MWPGSLVGKNTKITPRANLGKHMETLLKATLGHQDSKKKRKDQSLVNGAKDRSVFGMALEHAPQIITKYGELLSHIIDGKQDGSHTTTNFSFQIPIQTWKTSMPIIPVSGVVPVSIGSRRLLLLK